MKLKNISQEATTLFDSHTGMGAEVLPGEVVVVSDLCAAELSSSLSNVWELITLEVNDNG